MNPNATEWRIHNANIADWISNELIVDPHILFKLARSVYAKGVLSDLTLKIMIGMIVKIKWTNMTAIKCFTCFNLNIHDNTL